MTACRPRTMQPAVLLVCFASLACQAEGTGPIAPDQRALQREAAGFWSLEYTITDSIARVADGVRYTCSHQGGQVQIRERSYRPNDAFWNLFMDADLSGGEYGCAAASAGAVTEWRPYTNFGGGSTTPLLVSVSEAGEYDVFLGTTTVDWIEGVIELSGAYSTNRDTLRGLARVLPVVNGDATAPLGPAMRGSFRAIRRRD